MPSPPSSGPLSIPAWFDWRPRRATNSAAPRLPFNPSLVRLARLERLARILASDPFQSQLGSIGAPSWVPPLWAAYRLSIPAWFDWRTGPRLGAQANVLAFNPSLVRLARDESARCCGIAAPPFQSQLGSIGATPPGLVAHRTRNFQSQLGSIGARPSREGGAGAATFQSQLGSIGAFPQESVK